MRVVQPLKKQSFASYKIGEQKAARAAGQDRPDRAKLLQQYKSMNGAPVRDIGTGDPAFRPKDIASTTQSPNNPGPRGGLSPYTTELTRPAGSDIGGGIGGSGVVSNAPPRPMSAPGGGNPNLFGTSGTFNAPPMGGGMKKGGSVRAEKMASGGMTSKAPAASKRGDGIAQRGKTKGRMV